MFKVILAPNAFKECLDAHEVCESMNKGVENACKSLNIQVKTCFVPLADGGDGTQELLRRELGGYYVNMTNIMDPLFRRINSKYALIHNDTIAVIEMAAASGLWLLKDGEKRCINTTSLGFGQLIYDALTRKPLIKQLILCIGGSATNDGGIGIAYALGYRFYDRNHQELSPIGGNLQHIHTIDTKNVVKFNDDIEILVACDVDSPLLGPNGATAVYGPQKGLKMNDAKQLENGLLNLATIWKREFSYDAIGGTCGGGAAGGVGDGLRAFLGHCVQLKSGFELVAEYLQLSTALNDAQLCITGEGAIDGSTTNGKVPAGVVRYCKRYNVPCVAIGGFISSNIDELYELGLNSAFAIAQGPCTLEYSMENAAQLITKTTENIIRLYVLSYHHHRSHL